VPTFEMLPEATVPLESEVSRDEAAPLALSLRSEKPVGAVQVAPSRSPKAVRIQLVSCVEEIVAVV
jgi:hypothetical protein